MPLMDHFQPPLRQEVPWTGFHADWASAIAHDLNERGCRLITAAVPSVTLDGGAVEFDVATLRDAGWKEQAPTSAKACLNRPSLWELRFSISQNSNRSRSWSSTTTGK